MARRTAKKTQKSSKKTSKPTPRKRIFSGISPQRWFDIAGISLALISLLTIISLFVQNTGSITGWWVANLSMAFGWGVYLLPMALMGLAVWVFLRNNENMPSLSIERLMGIMLLFINLIVWFHLLLDGGYPEAQAGSGGGYIGAAIKILLVRTLGKPGAAIMLIAWLLISLILALDFAMLSFIRGMGKLIKRAWQKLNDIIQAQRERAQKRKHHQATSPRQQLDGSSQTHAHSQMTPASGNEQAGQATLNVQGESNRLYYDHIPQKPVWVLPNLDDILEPSIEPEDNGENDHQRARVIEETLRSFGAPAKVVDIRRGPAITLFGIEPDFVKSRNGRTRVRVSKITSLADDLALALAAARIRIQAPVPGKGYIGIEVPNRKISLVSLKDVINSTPYQNLKSPMKMAFGKDVAGNAVAADLTAMPHLLIAGTTGAGKSVSINSILTTFLLTKTPDELRLILVDPKRVELTGYNGIPHLLSPVIVDAEHVVGALQWMMREMDSRYRKFSETGTRNIADYNAHCVRIHEKALPYLLVVIDELADLMMLAPDETERSITRLAQLARATGIHLIIATQRPSTDILTGLIKANFPARIAFAVASGVDSRVILDQPGAERLLGRGDMLFQAPDASAPVRIQGAFVSDLEMNRLATYWRGFTVSQGAPERPDQPAAFQTKRGVPLKQAPLWEEMEEEQHLDSRFDEAVDIVREEGQASISMLQRKMRIGYTRAARIIDKMEEKEIVSKPDPKTQIRDIQNTEKK